MLTSTYEINDLEKWLVKRLLLQEMDWTNRFQILDEFISLSFRYNVSPAKHRKIKEDIDLSRLVDQQICQRQGKALHSKPMSTKVASPPHGYTNLLRISKFHHRRHRHTLKKFTESPNQM